MSGAERNDNNKRQLSNEDSQNPPPEDTVPRRRRTQTQSAYSTAMENQANIPAAQAALFQRLPGLHRGELGSDERRQWMVARVRSEMPPEPLLQNVTHQYYQEWMREFVRRMEALRKEDEDSNMQE